MIFWLWFLLACVQCALLYVLARKGEALPRRAHEDDQENIEVPENRWPSVGLIVPVAGADARIDGAVRSLLAQDYPRVTPVLVTGEGDSAAAARVSRLKEEFPVITHVTAPRADCCGQKNRNHLAGIAALGESVQTYVFCDATHTAEPDFLRHLVGPIARGEASFTTGYHWVDPRNPGRVPLAHALCVLLMRLLQALTPATQLWGGAMAMTRAAFVRYGVADMWAENVVDDCSLSALLAARGVKVRLCPGALLRTPEESASRSAWGAWMERQVLFLKFCMPEQWIGLGVFCAIMAVPLLCAALALLGGLVNVGGGSGVLLSVFWLAALTGALFQWRGLLPVSLPLWRWGLAFVDAVIMFASVYVRTIGAREMLWHGIRYEVDRGGVVRNVHYGSAFDER